MTKTTTADEFQEILAERIGVRPEVVVNDDGERTLRFRTATGFLIIQVTIIRVDRNDNEWVVGSTSVEPDHRSLFNLNRAAAA